MTQWSDYTSTHTRKQLNMCSMQTLYKHEHRHTHTHMALTHLTVQTSTHTHIHGSWWQNTHPKFDLTHTSYCDTMHSVYQHRRTQNEHSSPWLNSHCVLADTCTHTHTLHCDSMLKLFHHTRMHKHHSLWHHAQYLRANTHSQLTVKQSNVYTSTLPLTDTCSSLLVKPQPIKAQRHEHTETWPSVTEYAAFNSTQTDTHTHNCDSMRSLYTYTDTQTWLTVTECADYASKYTHTHRRLSVTQCPS